MDNENYSAEFVYRPSIIGTECQDATIKPVRFLENQILNENWIVNLKSTTEETCPCCDANDFIRRINDINEETSLCEDLELLKKAVVFILENTEWKTSHETKSR